MVDLHAEVLALVVKLADLGLLVDDDLVELVNDLVERLVVQLQILKLDTAVSSFKDLPYLLVPASTSVHFS